VRAIEGWEIRGGGGGTSGVGDWTKSVRRGVTFLGAAAATAVRGRPSCGQRPFKTPACTESRGKGSTSSCRASRSFSAAVSSLRLACAMV